MLPDGLSPEAPPRRQKSLTDGRTNESHLIAVDDYSVGLRLNSPNSGALGIDREVESLVLKAVAQINLTPSIVHIDTNYQFLVTEYRPTSPESALRDTTKAQVLAALDRLKAISLPLPVFDYVLHLQSYLNQLSKAGVQLDQRHQQRWNKFLPTLVSLQNSAASRSLCHHDLSSENIIVKDDGKVEFIDWEYAGIGFPELDLLQVDPEADVELVFHELAFWLDYLWVKQRALA